MGRRRFPAPLQAGRVRPFFLATDFPRLTPAFPGTVPVADAGVLHRPRYSRCCPEVFRLIFVQNRELFHPAFPAFKVLCKAFQGFFSLCSEASKALHRTFLFHFAFRFTPVLSLLFLPHPPSFYRTVLSAGFAFCYLFWYNNSCR